jgi:hypothetical protein
VTRCIACGVQGNDKNQFRAYYPSISAPPVHYCQGCWAKRDRRQQLAGLQIAAGFFVAAVIAAAVLDLGDTTRLARVALWLIALDVGATVLHELGHAAVVLAFGARLHTISFGYGQVLHTVRWGETTLELRNVPVCGFVAWSGLASRVPRLRRALVAAGGPAVNIGLFLWALHMIGGWPGDDLSLERVTPWHMLVAVNGLILAFNLVPFAFPDGDAVDRGGPWTPNDGLQIARSFAASSSDVHSWNVSGAVFEARALVKRGDVDAAHALMDAQVQAFPEEPALRAVQGHLHLQAEEWVRASEAFAVCLAAEPIGALRVEALAGAAQAAVARGNRSEADRFSREALKADPTSLAARLARGTALLGGGFVPQAEEHLQAVLAGASEPSVRRRAAQLLAAARLEAGDAEGAQRYEELT